MKLWLAFLMGLKEISAHSFRSFLTMLGIILGVASLLATFALSAGIAHGMRDFMTQIGGIERVEVDTAEVPENQLLMADVSPGRTVADAEAIQRSANLVSFVSPVSEVSAAITRGAETQRASVHGCWPDYLPINKHEIEFGRSIKQLDLDEARHVCVVGRTLVDRLWPGRKNYNALGEFIQVNGRPYRIIGILTFYEREEDKRRRERGEDTKGVSRSGRPRGRNYDPFYRKNMSVLVPISTVFYDFKSAQMSGQVDLGPNYRLDQLVFQVSDVERFKEAIEQVRGLLNTTHRGVEDFSFDTREEWFENMEKSIRSTRVSGGLIAGISLIVGGIGITNIMLASITERIREIGVRRAIGAKGRDIFIQIIVESGVIGVLGGLVGLVAALGLLRVLATVTESENVPVIEPGAVLVSFTFAVAIGVFSGLYPAFKASRLDPIEALRYG